MNAHQKAAIKKEIGNLEDDYNRYKLYDPLWRDAFGKSAAAHRSELLIEMQILREGL